jgi:hypothetical protein
VSYWVNNLVLANWLPTLVLLMFFVLRPPHLRANAAVLVISAFLQTGIWVWGVVGAFRSANRHVARGGTLLWANVARTMIGIAVFVFVVRLGTHTIPTMWSMAAIAVGHDPMSKIGVATTSDGKSLWAQNMIGEGSAAAVDQALNSSPRVSTVILSSVGGRITEAESIALLVKQKHLNTTVQGNCLSACTYILLAGAHRSAPQSAKIGFHQATFPGTTNLGQMIIDHQMVDYYRSAGVTQSFIDRVMATPSVSMWYPTRDELIEAGVLNQTSDDTE